MSSLECHNICSEKTRLANAQYIIMFRSFESHKHFLNLVHFQPQT